ncbi:hypothetical protein E3N88_09410 [Mikania micrantha]|uniref:Leucine-rich repeat-containing N-terminal plant-type domain-containing protein n=1 Tax=Mikania micrantha TaxID=192012 RepID=A0A5N6PJ18_9ASTR|nr:hypothetical protein E3N88_09410 [Mikania micrantha]
MESWCFVKHKASFLIFMMLLIFMLGWAQGIYIEDERKALLEIKASLLEVSNFLNVENLLPTWVDHGKYCDWERIKCNTTPGFVTDLSLGDMFSIEKDMDDFYAFHRSHELIWRLNASLFLNFKELRSLDLSWNYIGDTFVSSGLERLSELKTLENLNLGYNFIETNIFPSLSELTSLKILNLSRVNGYIMSSPTHDISEFRIPENLEVLDLTGNGYYGTLQIQGSQKTSKLSRLKSLNLARNHFNESLITALTTFTSLKTLDLRVNSLCGPFPSQEISELTNLEMVDLSSNRLNATPSIQDCKSLMRLERLESVSLAENNFNKSIIACLSFLPTLNILDLSNSYNLGMPNLPYLEVLVLIEDNLNGTLPMEALASFHHLKLLDLSFNNFIGSIPSTIKSLSSLQVVSFAYNSLNGSLYNDGFCDLKNLHVLDLSDNMFDGNLPKCFSGLSSLKFFDISSNQFTGIIPPSLIVNLTSLEYVDFSYNKFEGSFLFSLFFNHTKLQFFRFKSGGEKIEVETEEPIGWIPMFQLKFLALSNCIKKRPKGSVVPSFLLYQHELGVLDLSHNSLEGQVPNWLLKNNKNLEVLKLKDNSFRDVIHMGNKSIIKELDMSGNHITGNLSLDRLGILQLDNNCFTGNIGNNTSGNYIELRVLDISENHFTGRIPSWMSNMCSYFGYCELVARNTRLDGPFPCGQTSFVFLDISQNSFSGPIPSCINLKYTKHLHLGSNRFTGLVPDAFQNLTNVLTLDLSRNYLSGGIPEFLGELSNLRILLLGKNKFIGSIPEKFCQLNKVSLIDVSSNFLTGLIPRCLNNITGPKQLAFIQEFMIGYAVSSFWSDLILQYHIGDTRPIDSDQFETQDEIQFTTKNNPLSYKGNILDYMSGLDLSSNKLTGKIPEELGMLTHILALNLSHNKLSGPIPISFSNLSQIESLDLSSNSLSGKVPSELIQLTKLAVFDVSYNNLSGRLPERKAQFGTFGKESYEGNPLLCGIPLENNCTTTPQVSESSTKKDTEKWYDIDKASFYGSSCSTWFVFMLGFVAILYINPYWRRSWLEFIAECMYTCYYVLYDFVRQANPIKRSFHHRLGWRFQIYFLTSKDEAFRTFKKFKLKINNDIGIKLKMLRIDRGGEFTSNEFTQFCNDIGIARQLIHDNKMLCDRQTHEDPDPTPTFDAAEDNPITTDHAGLTAMDTRSSADLKKALESLEAEKRAMAEQLRAMQNQIHELSINRRHEHEDESGGSGIHQHKSGTCCSGKNSWTALQNVGVVRL